MKLIIIILLSMAIALPVNADVPIKKIIDTSWLKQETLKWGFVGSLCGFQALNGMVEGYHFRQENTYVINDSNYHAFVTTQRLAGISTGWFAYANFRNKNQTWFGKVRRAIGASLISRNCFEWAYKGVRYGNPFDSNPYRNEHSIVYFGIRNGRLTDLYIGTGKVTTPLVDIGCLLLGWIILE